MCFPLPTEYHSSPWSAFECPKWLPETMAIAAAYKLSPRLTYLWWSSIRHSQRSTSVASNKLEQSMLSMELHGCNLSIWETEARGSGWVWIQPGWKDCSKKTKQGRHPFQGICKQLPEQSLTWQMGESPMAGPSGVWPKHSMCRCSTSCFLTSNS